MVRVSPKRVLLFGYLLLLFTGARAQPNIRPALAPQVFAGIEVGSKGVKMTIVESGRSGSGITTVKDTSVNTDFISFTQPTYQSTLAGLSKLYEEARTGYNIPSDHIFTAISSGVKIQADKESRNNWIDQLISAFKSNIREPDRKVTVVDVVEEARLSHLGIIPDQRRYNTFLIDIGSGNTKGGYFPKNNTKDLKLFQLTWGTKSTGNATEKRCIDDKGIPNYYKQLQRVLLGAEDDEISYAVNASGAYPLSDNVAFSGGIAWSLATLMYPELIDQAVVPVSYDDMLKFNDRILNSYTTLSDYYITHTIVENTADTAVVAKEVKRVNQVFDQKALLAGTGLMLKIMRQFVSIYERKQFFLVKNGQVGWISAFVNERIKK